MFAPRRSGTILKTRSVSFNGKYRIVNHRIAHDISPIVCEGNSKKESRRTMNYSNLKLLHVCTNCFILVLSFVLLADDDDMELDEKELERVIF